MVARRFLRGYPPAHVSRRTSAVALAALLSALALLAAGCGGGGGTSNAASAAPKPAAPSCPAAWRVGWQRLANKIDAPVYCPSWVPDPLTGELGGQGSAQYVEPDRSYLVAFIWLDTTPTGGEEVHVNLRGYPGRLRIPTCEDTLTVNGKTTHPKMPCFDDARAVKRFGTTKATLYTSNQGADQWHLLYAWRHSGSLYTLSEHVAPPFSYPQVVSNLNRMMRGLVLLKPLAEESGRLK
jgi:hypothetical protein